MKRTIAIVPVVLVGAIATGCADGDHADLQAFADRTAERFRPEPTSDTHSSPAADLDEPFAYPAGELRDPFQPPPTLKPVSDAGQSQVAPDFERTKGHLERFALAQLRLVGRLSGGRAHVALVQDPDGLVHPVAVGEHMGTDFGRIRSIGEDRIELIEIVRDAGGWVERPRLIALTGGAQDEQGEQSKQGEHVANDEQGDE